MKKISFYINESGDISDISKSYTATFESPFTGKQVSENVQEELELEDLHKELNLNGNAAKIARLEERDVKKDEVIARKNQRIEKLLTRLNKAKEKADKRLAELKAK